MLFSEIETCFIHLVFKARFFVTHVQRCLSFLHTAEDQTIKFIKKIFTLLRCSISWIDIKKSYLLKISLNIFIRDWDFVFLSTYFCSLQHVWFSAVWNWKNNCCTFVWELRVEDTFAICKEWQWQILALLMINISNIHLISCLRFASLLAETYS